MENSDLAIEIERFMRDRGISHDDSVAALIEALYEDAMEGFE